MFPFTYTTLFVVHVFPKIVAEKPIKPKMAINDYTSQCMGISQTSCVVNQ